MRPVFLTLLLWLLAVVPVHAAMIWDVRYFTRGDISQVSGFYGPGTYEFLLAPDHVSVYLLQGGTIGTQFLGYYGTVVLPDGFPVIAFPSGTDQAVAVPVFDGQTTGSSVAPVPEGSTGVLLLAAVVMAALFAMRFNVGLLE
jgi:hypothetical protein